VGAGEEGRKGEEKQSEGPRSSELATPPGIIIHHLTVAARIAFAAIMGARPAP
jgi:hypothetical protein